MKIKRNTEKVSGKTVLISGASIAGPTLAFWLNRYGFRVTVVERADELRLGGQNIDVRDAAQGIMQLMGLEAAIRSANTGELGVRFVDGNNQVKAELPKGDDGLGTSDLEILRGDLAKILYDSTKADVTYIFGDQITALDEQESMIKVTFRNAPSQGFDIVVAADGIRSTTRRLMFGDEPVIKPIGLYNAYLTIPRTAADSLWACWYNATGSRVITTRPDNQGTIRASFSFLSSERGYEKLDIKQQKQILKAKFADAGWQSDRVLAELDQSKDVYFDSISQVIAPRWSNGRCAMVGDAAYCPTPMKGMGASLSIVGAYVLAGELSKHADYQSGFSAYEKLMRPYVEDIQKLPPGVPWIAHPKTKLGVALFNSALRLFASKTVRNLSKLISKKMRPQKNTIVLPQY